MILSTPSTRCWLSVKDKYPHQSGQDFPFDWGLVFFFERKDRPDEVGLFFHWNSHNRQLPDCSTKYENRAATL